MTLRLLTAATLCLIYISAFSGCGLRAQPALGDRTLLCGLPSGGKKVSEVLASPGYRLVWPVAHRGDRNSGWDNSREAIDAAARYGVPLIEIDVRLSLDGTPVLFHDRTLRQSNSRGPRELTGRPINSLTDPEIRLFRLPARTRGAVMGTESPILFFADALEVIRPYKTAFQVDMKGDSKAIIEGLAREAGAAGQLHQLIIQTQQGQQLQYLRTHYPEIAVAARVRSAEQIEHALAFSPEFIVGEEDLLVPDIIRRIQIAGAKVCLKTVGPDKDTTERWGGLFRLGADTLMTDHGNKMMFFIRNRICGEVRRDE